MTDHDMTDQDVTDQHRSFQISDDLVAFAAITCIAPIWASIFALPVLAWCAGFSFGRSNALKPDYKSLAEGFMAAILALAGLCVVMNGAIGALAILLALPAAAQGEARGEALAHTIDRTRRKAHKDSIADAWRG